MCKHTLPCRRQKVLSTIITFESTETLLFSGVQSQFLAKVASCTSLIWPKRGTAFLNSSEQCKSLPGVFLVHCCEPFLSMLRYSFIVQFSGLLQICCLIGAAVTLGRGPGLVGARQRRRFG